MAARRQATTNGRRSAKVPQAEQHYRLVKRTLGNETAYVIQRNPPHRPGIWFDFEGYSNEHQAQVRFERIITDDHGVRDEVLVRKIKHTRAAKVLAQGEKQEKEESET